MCWLEVSVVHRYYRDTTCHIISLVNLKNIYNISHISLESFWLFQDTMEKPTNGKHCPLVFPRGSVIPANFDRTDWQWQNERGRQTEVSVKEPGKNLSMKNWPIGFLKKEIDMKLKCSDSTISLAFWRHTRVMIRCFYNIGNMNIRLLSRHFSSVSCKVEPRVGFIGRDQVVVISGASWKRGHGQRSHGQSVLLINSIQLLCSHSVNDEVKLLREGLTAVSHADIRNVGTTDVVTFRTLPGVAGTQPVAFSLKLEEATWDGTSEIQQRENKTSDWWYWARLWERNIEQE